MPGCVDACDRHRLADRLAGDLLDIALITVDIGQHHVTQRQEHATEHEVGDDQRLEYEAQHMVTHQIRITIAVAQQSPADDEAAAGGRGLMRCGGHLSGIDTDTT